MRRLILLLALAACGDNIKPQEQPPPVTPDAAVPDAPPEPPKLAPCLDRPNSIPQPGNQLPCELIPPSSTFQR